MKYGIQKPWENPFASYHNQREEGTSVQGYHADEKYESSELYHVEKGKEEEESNEETIEDEIKKEEKKEDEGDTKKKEGSFLEIKADVPVKKKSSSIDEAIEKAIKSEKEVIVKK